MTDDGAIEGEELDAEGERASPRGRRLVQVMLGLNVFLVATALMLPSFADFRLSALARDQAAIIAASGHIEVLRSDFASFYTDRAPREAVDAIFHQVEDGFDPHDLYTEDFRAADAQMVEDWRGFVQTYAFECPSIGETRESLARTFVLARQVFIAVKARNIPQSGDRDDSIAAMPVDQLLTFSCALHQMRMVLEHPVWLEQGPAWVTSAHSAKLELSTFQQQRPELFERLPSLADRAGVPFDLSTATDLDALDADFREQTTARRRDRDSARFAVPFVAITLDVRTLEYGILVVTTLLLIEAAIFHHALLLTPGNANAARRSYYFKTLTALNRRQEQPPPAAADLLERLAQMLSTPARWLLLILLWFGSWAPFLGHLRWSVAAGAGGLGDGLTLLALAGINTALVFWNLRQLSQLEAVPRTAPQSREIQEKPS